MERNYRVIIFRYNLKTTIIITTTFCQAQVYFINISKLRLSKIKFFQTHTAKPGLQLNFISVGAPEHCVEEDSEVISDYSGEKQSNQFMLFACERAVRLAGHAFTIIGSLHFPVSRTVISKWMCRL